MSKVLFLGSGQLGRMSAMAGEALGIYVDRVDLTTNRLLTGTDHQSKPIEFTDAMLDQYEVITAELEHLPYTPLVKQLTAHPRWANGSAFACLPDRFTQKTMLDDLHLPTAPWRLLNGVEDVKQAQSTLGPELIIKTTKGGYDGRGQWRLKECVANNTLSIEWPESLYGALIAEQKIPFSAEVSLIGVRDASGACAFLPLTHNVHHEGILRYSCVYSQGDAEQQAQAESMLTTIMNHFNYVGVMAMECFVTEINVTEKGLLINELAPRVHNSGHWSQLGAAASQFSWHLQVLTGAPVTDNTHYSPTLMLNLIGCEYHEKWQGIAGVQVHWYEKSVRAGRKLGHINFDASNKSALIHQVSSITPYLDDVHAFWLSKALENF